MFTPRDIAMSQLKNTGGLRLIGNRVVADSIIIYYNNIKFYETLGNMNSKFVEESFKEEMKFIDFNQIVKSGRLNITDVNKMRELGNRCFVYKIQIEAYSNFLKDIYYQGSSLIKYLQEEYDLKVDENQNN